jgi:hypothetical protein
MAGALAPDFVEEVGQYVEINQVCHRPFQIWMQLK